MRPLRRKRVSWGLGATLHTEDISSCREHADAIVVTDNFTPDQLIDHVEGILNNHGIYPCDRGEQYGS